MQPPRFPTTRFALILLEHSTTGTPLDLAPSIQHHINRTCNRRDSQPPDFFSFLLLELSRTLPLPSTRLSPRIARTFPLLEHPGRPPPPIAYPSRTFGVSPHSVQHNPPPYHNTQIPLGDLHPTFDPPLVSPFPQVHEAQRASPALSNGRVAQEKSAKQQSTEHEA